MEGETFRFQANGERMQSSRNRQYGSRPSCYWNSEHKYTWKTCQCWQWPSVGESTCDCTTAWNIHNASQDNVARCRRFQGKFHQEISEQKSRVIIRNPVQAVNTNMDILVQLKEKYVDFATNKIISKKYVKQRVLFMLSATNNIVTNAMNTMLEASR